MVDEIRTREDWKASSDEQQKKVYWLKVKRKAYAHFKERYVTEVNDFKRDLKHRVSKLSTAEQAELMPVVDSIPSIDSVPELDRLMELFERSGEEGETPTTSGAYKRLVSLKDESGEYLFKVTPDNLPAVDNEELRGEILKQRQELERIFTEFAKEIIPAASRNPPKPGLRSWWTIYKILRMIEKMTGVMLKGINIVLEWLINREDTTEEPPAEGGESG